ncbi:GspH family T2SS minor pseudopilin variant ExeH [Aeromonas taiwanensis]|uniref:GspH family T2SS minor pseudopilin variant ExeH n=1 Tax=Aeromonas taiwanensis TaxID=633417 RepID=UPI003B9E91C8
MSRCRQSGFTLLEVLLVAMLMGLVATAVTLSMGGARGDRELDKQARRFMATLQQAQEYSVMDGRLLGLRIEDNGWQFMSRSAKDRKWQALTGDKLLGPVTLPEAMTLAVELEGFGWNMESDERREQTRDEEERTPQILIFPGGEQSPFVLTLREQDEDQQYLRTVRGDEFGRLSLQEDEEEEE